MKLLQTASLIIALAMSPTLATAQDSYSNHGMDITWSFTERDIIFTINTPTTGWQAIGFNISSELEDTYLIMSSVEANKAEVVEHYVNSPGNYESISFLAQAQRAKILDYKETKKSTMIKFSLPQKADNKYQKDLTSESVYHMLYAYSLEDNFQHHSTFRSSVKIKL